jgi:large subunit ribosomal protein L21
MYAVIRTGGKQLRVAEGDTVRIERVSKETLSKGDELSLTEVLAVGREDGLHLGSPLVDGVTVKAVVVRETRGTKLLVYKKKRRKGFQRTHGHRQNLVEIRIQAIEG